MPELIPTDVADQAATYLSNLRTLLQDRGLHARLLTHPGQSPRLRVIGPSPRSVDTLSAG